MSTPLEVTFRGMSPSPSVEASVERWLTRLEHTYDRIQHCAVVIDVPHRRQRQGNQFQVRIDLQVPGKEIAVSHDPVDGSHEDVYVALSDAFRAARRQLQDHARIRRGA